MPAPVQTVRSTLPSGARNPRPNCCRNTTADSVGRSITSRSLNQAPGPVLTAHHDHHFALDLCAPYAFARIGAALAQGHAHSLPIRGHPHVAASP